MKKNREIHEIDARIATDIAEKIEELNGEMAELEATRDTLNEELDVLAKEIADLEAAQSTAEKEPGRFISNVKQTQKNISLQLP